MEEFLEHGPTGFGYARNGKSIYEAVQGSMALLDGSLRSDVKLLTGVTDEELDELGGFGDDATETK